MKALFGWELKADASIHTHRMEFRNQVWLVCLFFSLVKGQAWAQTLEVVPSVLSRSGDAVTIEVKGVTSPLDFDWIGIYSPPDSDDKNYIGYLLLSLCSGQSQGFCSIRMPLVNLREAYQFRLFQGINLTGVEDTLKDEDGDPLPSVANRLALSKSVEFSNYNEPTQIHLSLTDSIGEMRAMFVTRDPLKTFIKYGLKDDGLDMVAETSASTYRQSDMCDLPANTSQGWRNPGYIHDGVMGNLVPGELYFYQVGSDEGGWSGVYNFTAAEINADETHAFLFGDMGTSLPYKTFLRLQAESKNTVKWLLRDLEELGNHPSLISHIGDISYARGYAWLWDAFFSQIEPIAARAPYHVCIGNHEYDWPSQPWKPLWAKSVYGTDGGGECGVPYSTRFHMPSNYSYPTGNGLSRTRNLFYSVDLGVVRFVYISTETDLLPGSDQYAFLKRDLGSVDRKRTPFMVVLGHRPMYTSNFEPNDAPLRAQMMQHLEPLFVEHKVDLVLWGHVHKYERICPIQNLTCVEEGGFPVHVVIGMGGQDFQPKWAPRFQHPDDPIFPQPNWSIYRSEEFGYTRLNATRERLTLSYIGNHDGAVHDSLTLFSTFAKEPHSTANHSSSSLSLKMFYFLIAACTGLGLTAFVVLILKCEEQKKKGWVPVTTDSML